MKFRVAVVVTVLSLGATSGLAEETRSREEIIASGLGVLTALTVQCGDFRIDEDLLAKFLQTQEMPDPRHDANLREHWLRGTLKMEGEFRNYEFEGRDQRQISAWACSIVIKGLTDPKNDYRTVVVRN